MVIFQFANCKRLPEAKAFEAPSNCRDSHGFAGLEKLDKPKLEISVIQ
jgi:hypothetical protein